MEWTIEDHRGDLFVVSGDYFIISENGDLSIYRDSDTRKQGECVCAFAAGHWVGCL